MSRARSPVKSTSQIFQSNIQSNLQSFLPVKIQTIFSQSYTSIYPLIHIYLSYIPLTYAFFLTLTPSLLLPLPPPLPLFLPLLGYYKFHRTNDSVAGCERSCAMLNATDTSVDFDKDLALALFTTPDTTASLTLARRLGKIGDIHLLIPSPS